VLVCDALELAALEVALGADAGAVEGAAVGAGEGAAAAGAGAGVPLCWANDREDNKSPIARVRLESCIKHLLAV